MEEFLRYREAAEILRISELTLRKWVAERRVPFCKIGGRVIFEPERLMEWVQGQRVEPIGSGKPLHGRGV